MCTHWFDVGTCTQVWVIMIWMRAALDRGIIDGAWQSDHWLCVIEATWLGLIEACDCAWLRDCWLCVTEGVHDRGNLALLDWGTYWLCLIEGLVAVFDWGTYWLCTTEGMFDMGLGLMSLGMAWWMLTGLIVTWWMRCHLELAWLVWMAWYYVT